MVFPSAFAIILAVTCDHLLNVQQYTVTSNHVKVSSGCQTDFLLFETKPDFCKLF